jgi:hypothetical protein
MRHARYFIIFISLLFTLSVSWYTFGAVNRGVVVVQTEEGSTIDLYKGSYALVIGNGSYHNGWDPLSGAIQDVREVARALDRSGFQVTLKTDLSRNEFHRAVSEFVLNHGEESDARLLFYYAGHGYTKMSATGEEIGYLVMVDAPDPGKEPVGFSLASIDMQYFISQAKMIKARHVLFIFDSCFSGSILNLRERVTPESVSDNIKHPVRQFITAGRANEPVPDYSVFKQAFLDLLEGRDREPIMDGYITGEELGLYLKTKVPEYNPSQHPQYGKIRDPKLDKGDFVFLTRSSGAGGAPVQQAAGSLRIDTDPSGAEVFVDSARKGTAPVFVEHITPGKVRVRAEMKGYDPKEELAWARAGKETRLTLVLEKTVQEGIVAVRSRPEGARWYLDGAYVGVTPKELDGVNEGRHVITIRKAGYFDQEQKIQVRAGERVNVDVVLEPDQPVDFSQGSKTVWLADFSKWPKVGKEHGSAGPRYGDYVLEAYSNTWIGPGRYMELATLTKDFIVDLSFKVLHKTSFSLNINLSDAGRNYSQIAFYFSLWESGDAVFSINERWVKDDFYVNNKREISSRDSVENQLVSHVNWNEVNRLSFKREGSQVSFYFNNRLLKSFQASHFDVKKIGISLAFKSKVQVTALEARVPFR